MIPKRLLPHRVSYRPLTGYGPRGKNYGDPVNDVPARVVFVRRLVSTKAATEVMSTATIYFQPSRAPQLDALVRLPDASERPVIAVTHSVGGRDVELVTIDVG